MDHPLSAMGTGQQLLEESPRGNGNERRVAWASNPELVGRAVCSSGAEEPDSPYPSPNLQSRLHLRPLGPWLSLQLDGVLQGRGLGVSSEG